jgi:hypothetical protein
MKTVGVKSFDVSVITTAAPVQPTNGITVFVQHAILFADPMNSAKIFVGGPASQDFPLVAGSSIDLGDLFIGSKHSEFDLFQVYVKSDSGTQVLHVIHPEEYNR